MGAGRRRRNVFHKKGITIARTDLRVNDQIRVSPVRLINEENVQVGIIETKQALALALEAGLDLVEVSPNEEPPVCRIMDYGKWKYSRSKKTTKTKAHVSILKEIRLRPKTGIHDQEVKIKRAREFLGKGDKVLFSMRFRGREMAHQDIGT
ncbi:MAG: translation initiation factor IF-3, partial [Phycisphaerae bacterium]|nr:translation initiation factor IF-3 [Phycisphaerae bacterium]